jgi:hypothetical protein
MGRRSLIAATLLLLLAPAARADEAVLQVAGALAKPGSLNRILTRFGFEPGTMGKDVPKHEKRKGWRMAIRASAPDGFEAILSCAEVPLRLVVLTDKQPSRSVYGVRKLEVLDLRSGR